MWIKAGEGWGIDPAESARRVAVERRGGYCYHLNGALGALLQSLGYDVTGHVGGVHGPGGQALAVAVGVVSCPQHASEVDELLELADSAMYRAKAAGERVAVGPEEADE